MTALTGNEYDKQWSTLGDFINYNPGARHRRRILTNILNRIEFKSVCDVGCGSGELLLTMHELYSSANIYFCGADFATLTIEKNKLIYPWATFYHLDITNDALEMKFDLVVCSEVLEHLNSPDIAMENLAAMVNIGGHLLISCPTGKIYPTERHFGHISHPTIGELERYADRNSLQVVTLLNWGYPFYKILKELVNINSLWTLQNFGNGSYSFAKKRINDLLYFLNFLNFDSPFGTQLFCLYKKRGP